MGRKLERVVDDTNMNDLLPMHFFGDGLPDWAVDQKWKIQPMPGDEIYFCNVGGGLASRQFYELVRNGEVIDGFLVSGS